MNYYYDYYCNNNYYYDHNNNNTSKWGYHRCYGEEALKGVLLFVTYNFNYNFNKT